MSAPAEQERRTVWYSGRVQGVGFRWTTARVASQFAVSGTVRNLADGRVEVVAEGAADELDRFLAAVAGSMQSHIRKTHTATSPGTGEFASFRIRQ